MSHFENKIQEVINSFGLKSQVSKLSAFKTMVKICYMHGAADTLQRIKEHGADVTSAELAHMALGQLFEQMESSRKAAEEPSKS